MKAFVFLFVISLQSFGQDDYGPKLSKCLEEVRKLEYFDNGVVILDESTDYGSTFSRWAPDLNFHTDDIVTFDRATRFLALKDNRGKSPSTSPNDWRLIYGPHPYLFLRDSVKTEDLKQLLISDHLFIRTYAFGALVHRGIIDGLYEVVLKSMADKTVIEQYTSDYGYEVCQADLMLWYAAKYLSVEQKNWLKYLMITKYNHLKTLEKVLLFHKSGLKGEYDCIKGIVKGGAFGPFGLIALSRYKRKNDIELIMERLVKFDDYEGRFYLYFIAIENFPDVAFKKVLVEYANKVKMDYGVEGYKYFFNSLAAYHDNDFVKIFEDFINQESQSEDNPFQSSDYRKGNLKMIYQSLKKHYSPIYDNLMRSIEAKVLITTDSMDYNYLDTSPWNY